MKVEEIEVDKIEVLENIRQKPLKEDLSELMESIKNDGLFQPIGVKPVSGGFLLVWGFRRLTAFKKLGKKTIPANILEESDIETEEDFLIKNASENIHRKQIDAIELGRICWHLEKSMNRNEVAVKLSIPRSRVKNAVESFLRVPTKFRDSVRVFEAGNSTKKAGKLGSNLAYTITHLRKVTEEDRHKIFEWAIKEEKINSEVILLGELIRNGSTLTQAMKQLENVRSVSMKFLVNKKRFEEMMRSYPSFIEYVRKLINKNEPNLII